MDKTNNNKNVRQLNTGKTVAAIVLFIVSYIAIVFFAFWFSAKAIQVTLGFATKHTGTIPVLLLAFVFIFIAVVLFFLLKFIFSHKSNDPIGTIEITRQEEPLVFELLDEVSKAVNADFPKKVFVSGNVNAGVFHDSSFWGMLVSPPRNLELGMGLVNVLTVEELKSVLAHEFGHFSQGELKVGGYVFQVRRILRDMLNDEEHFDTIMYDSIGTDSALGAAVGLGVVVVKGFRWVLKQLYFLVEYYHLELSRVLEYHADEVAVRYAGKQAFKNSMAKLPLASATFSEVYTSYLAKARAGVVCDNFFTRHFFLMKLYSRLNGFQTTGLFPAIHEKDYTKSIKSRLVFEDKWASHPSDADRLAAIEKIDVESKPDDGVPANTLFRKLEFYQRELTTLGYYDQFVSRNPRTDTVEEFGSQLLSDFEQNNSAHLFNGYFEGRSVPFIDIKQRESNPVIPTKETLFGPSAMELLRQQEHAKYYLEVFEVYQKEKKTHSSFYFDGVKYAKKETPKVMAMLLEELKKVEVAIALNDEAIFYFFLENAKRKNSLEEFERLSVDLNQKELLFDARMDVLEEIQKESAFMYHFHDNKTIRDKMTAFKYIEPKLKAVIKETINEEDYQPVIDDELRDFLDFYITKDFFYYYMEEYEQSEVSIFQASLRNLQFLLESVYLPKKKAYLEFHNELMEQL